jgi:hypothetical protein
MAHTYAAPPERSGVRCWTHGSTLRRWWNCTTRLLPHHLHEDVDAEYYEGWIRRVDYPDARAQGAITSYTVTRIDGTLSGNGEARDDYSR